MVCQSEIVSTMDVDFVVRRISHGDVIDDIGGGLRGPKDFDVEAYLTTHKSIEVHLRIALVDGAYSVTELSLTGTGKQVVTTEFLRLLPLRSIVRATAGRELRILNFAKEFDLRPAPSGGTAFGNPSTAFTYRLARVLGEPPIQAVMEKEGISRSTASRRVAAARKAGDLGADETGPAGGARSRLGE